MARILGVQAWPGPPEQIARAAAVDQVRQVTAGAGFVQVSGVRGDLAEAEGLVVAVDGQVPALAGGDRGAGDASRIATLVRRSGIAGAAAQLDGQYAVAVADPRAGRLWLVRDRLGIKPLYYTRAGGGIAFASQPGPLLRLPGIDTSVDRRYVALMAGGHYRAFDNDPASSPYAGIGQLPAGCILSWHEGNATVTRYWDLADRAAAESRAGPVELAATYRQALSDAVGRRVALAERPAFTLSGGMDSSSVLATAAGDHGVAAHAYSSVYGTGPYDESDEIASMLGLVADWHRVPVTEPDVLSLVADMVAVHDEPVATATWLSHYLLAGQVAGAGHDVLFGGLGGDELNAGEYEHFVFHFADLLASGRRADYDDEVAAWAAHHDHPVFRKSAEVAAAEVARRTDPSLPGGNRPDTERLLRYAAAVDPGWLELAGFDPVMDHPFDSHLRNRCYQDLFRETTPCCLRAQDRHAEHFGLQSADPFLDHRLVEFCFGVPGDLKISGGVTKRLLRVAMAGVLPDDTRTRVAKTGWNAPADAWFAGHAYQDVADLIASRRFRERGVYVPGEPQRLLDEHRQIVSSGRPAENHMMFLWQLVNLELWLQHLESRP